MSQRSSEGDVILITGDGPQHLSVGDATSMLETSATGGFISGRCTDCDSIVLMYGDFEQTWVDHDRSMGPEVGYQIRHHAYCDHCGEDLFLNSFFSEYPHGSFTFYEIEPEGAEYYNIQHVESMIDSVSTGQSSIEDVFRTFGDLEAFFESESERPLATALNDLREASMRSVVVLGNFSDPYVEELEDIRDDLNSRGYDAYIAEDLEAESENAVDRFAKLLINMTSFGVMVDRVASGHVAEYEYSHQGRHILARLQPESPGRPSTAMIGPHEEEVDYMKEFQFSDSPSEVIDDVVDWAESVIETRSNNNEMRFPWY